MHGWGPSGNRTAVVYLYVSTAQRSRLKPLTPAGDDYKEIYDPGVGLIQYGV